MRWRFHSKRKPDDEGRAKDLTTLVSSEAMMNRCALRPETLRLHSRVVELGASGSLEESGRLSYELVGMSARENGRTPPRNIEEAVSFLQEELRGFDTAEARERAEQARLNEIIKLLRGNQKV